MRRIIIVLVVLSFIVLPVSALEITAPTVPESAEELLPNEPETFGQGLWQVIKAALRLLQPAFVDAVGVCLCVLGAVLLLSLLNTMYEGSKRLTAVVGAAAVAGFLLKPANALINLGIETVTELSEYGKLLLPVMTTAMAAQGSVTTSGALYAGTAVFDMVLTSGITKLLIPLLYIFLAFAVANSAMGEDVLKQLRDFAKWLISWGLKIILYIFTGYLGITGAVSGAADAAAVKAAKLTISGVIPVVGGIISDASETVLVSAGVVKNAAGVYGMLALFAVWIGPFIQIGVQYLLLKLTGVICSVFGSKEIVGLIHDFTAAMGLILAMTGTVCLMLLISTVCFLKGVA